MITNAKISKKLRAILLIMDYAFDLLTLRKKAQQKQKPSPSRKLSHAPISRNVPPGKDVRGYIAGLLLIRKKKCNGLLSGTHSLPNGVTFSPSQWALFRSLFLFHLSKVAIVARPKDKQDKQTKLERLKFVDIERELVCYAVPHANTKNLHEHWGICLVHPLTRRMVEINGGNYKEAVAYALNAALNDLGYGVENPFMVGPTRTGRPVATEARFFDKDNILKSAAQLKAEGLVEDIGGVIKRRWKKIMVKVGIPESPQNASDAVEATKAEKIRGEVNVARVIQEYFFKGPDHLNAKDPKENRQGLDKMLRELNGGLKKVKGGLVFSINGLHAAASDVKIEPKWTAEIVETRCGLTGENWRLGIPEREQSQKLRDEEIEKFQLARRRLNQKPSASLMCDFMRSIPKEWRRVQVDILKSDNEWVFIDEMDVDSIAFTPQREPGFLNLAEIADKDDFPLGMVFITPVLPERQLPLTLYNIPAKQIEKLRKDLDPAYVVQMGNDLYAAMILIERLQQGQWQTHNARLRLGYEYSQKYGCDYGIYGVPLPGLPLFPEPNVAKLAGKPHARVSAQVQNDLVATWQKVQAEELAWWKRVPKTTLQWLSAQIESDLSRYHQSLPEILSRAIARTTAEWVAPAPVKQAVKRSTPPPRQAAPSPQPLATKLAPKQRTNAEKQPTKTSAKPAENIAQKRVEPKPSKVELISPGAQIVPQTPAPSPSKAKTDVVPQKAEAEPPTPPAQPPPPTTNPKVDAEEKERRKKLAAKKRVLWAGVYQFNGQSTKAEHQIAQFDLDVDEVNCAEILCVNLYRCKNDGRFKELLKFIRPASVKEPEWLAAEFEYAMQLLMLQKQNQQPTPIR